MVPPGPRPVASRTWAALTALALIGSVTVALAGPAGALSTLTEPGAPQDVSAASQSPTVVVNADPDLDCDFLPDLEGQGHKPCLGAATGVGEVRVQWGSPDYLGGAGSVIEAYHIYRATEPHGNFSLVDTVPGFVETGEQVYYDRGLDPLTTYWYTVSAENQVGEGPPSESSCAAPGPWVDFLEPPTAQPCDPLP